MKQEVNAADHNSFPVTVSYIWLNSKSLYLSNNQGFSSLLAKFKQCCSSSTHRYVSVWTCVVPQTRPGVVTKFREGWMRCWEITHWFVAPCCWECLQSPWEGQWTSRTFLLESLVNHYQSRVPPQREGLDSAVTLHKDKAAAMTQRMQLSQNSSTSPTHCCSCTVQIVPYLF